MTYVLDIGDKARKGLQKIAKSGDAGRLKQTKKALNQLAEDPQYPSLNTHKMRKSAAFGSRDDLWISYIRTGPGGERIVWAYGTKNNEVQILDIEYVGSHID